MAAGNEARRQSLSKSPAPVTPKKATDPREVFEAYLRGTEDGKTAYARICSALLVLPDMRPEAIAHFIAQLAPVTDLLDASCGALVKNLCSLQWARLPREVRPQIALILTDLVALHVSHVDTVIHCAVNHLRPSPPSTSESFDAAEGEEIFRLAHSIVNVVLKVYPTSTAVVSKTVSSSFPFHAGNANDFLVYAKNIIQMGEYALGMRQAIWECLIYQLCKIDTFLGVSAQERLLDDTIFSMDIDVSTLAQSSSAAVEEGLSKSDQQKLLADEIVAIILSYIDAVHGIPVNSDVCDLSWLHFADNMTNPEHLFELLWKVFDKDLLGSQQLGITPFIWLYLGSKHPQYASEHCERLWNVVSTTSRFSSAGMCINEWTRAQCAANHLASFLSRAKFIGSEEAEMWLSRMCSWLCQYLDGLQGTTARATTGQPRHGTFYAVCQAVCIVFAFRYKSIVERRGGMQNLSDVAEWGWTRILHSELQPLRWMSRPVALCFSAIARSLQLVYCQHLVPTASELALFNQTPPFDHHFPLDRFPLPRCSVIVAPLLRRFSPMREDRFWLTAEIANNSLGSSSKVDESLDDGMEFLEFDALASSQSSNMARVGGACSTQAGDQKSLLFTIYSTSPGLRSFESPSG